MQKKKISKRKKGLSRELNPGPLAGRIEPKARIMRLDH